MKILVTGSEGNIGRRLVPYFKSMGHEVFRFDIRQGCGEDYLTGDVCNAYELQKAFNEFRPEVVVKLGGEGNGIK